MGKVSSRSASAWNESAPGAVFGRAAGVSSEAKSVHVRQAGVWVKVFKYFEGFLRPDADIETSDWTATPLWSKLDETSPDDATTEIDSSEFSDPDVAQTFDFEIRLTDPPSTPTGRETITWRVRHYLEVVSGNFDTDVITLELKQGSTVIATQSVSANTSYTTDSDVLSQAEKDSITDWTDLRIKVTYTIKMTNEGDSATAHVTWIELEGS